MSQPLSIGFKMVTDRLLVCRNELADCRYRLYLSGNQFRGYRYRLGSYVYHFPGPMTSFFVTTVTVTDFNSAGMNYGFRYRNRRRSIKIPTYRNPISATEECLPRPSKTVHTYKNSGRMNCRLIA